MLNHYSSYYTSNKLNRQAKKKGGDSSRTNKDTLIPFFLPTFHECYSKFTLCGFSSIQKVQGNIAMASM